MFDIVDYKSIKILSDLITKFRDIEKHIKFNPTFNMVTIQGSDNIIKPYNCILKGGICSKNVGNLIYF